MTTQRQSDNRPRMRSTIGRICASPDCVITIQNPIVGDGRPGSVPGLVASQVVGTGLSAVKI